MAKIADRQLRHAETFVENRQKNLIGYSILASSVRIFHCFAFLSLVAIENVLLDFDAFRNLSLYEASALLVEGLVGLNVVSFAAQRSHCSVAVS